MERAGASTEHDETIGWHLEQAHRLLGELGPLDAAGRKIGERAAKHLASAGRRALAGDDVSLAASLLGRATERLDADDDARADLALDWCDALLAAGDVGSAAGAIDELGRFVGDSERLRAWHTCFAGQHTILTAPERLQQTVEDVAGAVTTLAAQNDDAGEAKAHYVHALALSRLGQVGACEASLDLALAAARRVTGDRRRANTVLAIAPLAALWGPSAVTRASGRCLDVVRVLRITQGAPAVEAVALSCQGVLEALRGRTDAARRMIASAREMVEELGITQRLRELDVFTGLVDLYEGDFAAAERSLRIAYDGLRELGLGVDAARAAALLARALLGQDRVDEAEALSHESEALAGDDLKAAIAWRGVRAEALARSGEHAAAVALAVIFVILAFAARRKMANRILIPVALLMVTLAALIGLNRSNLQQPPTNTSVQFHQVLQLNADALPQVALNLRPDWQRNVSGSLLVLGTLLALGGLGGTVTNKLPKTIGIACTCTGAAVVLACRSESRGAEARDRIRAELPDAEVLVMKLDLADLDQVREFEFPIPRPLKSRISAGELEGAAAGGAGQAKGHPGLKGSKRLSAQKNGFVRKKNQPQSMARSKRLTPNSSRY